MTARTGDALSHVNFQPPSTAFSGAILRVESGAANWPSAGAADVAPSAASSVIPPEFAWAHERTEQAGFGSDGLLAQAL